MADSIIQKITEWKDRLERVKQDAQPFIDDGNRLKDLIKEAADEMAGVSPESQDPGEALKELVEKVKEMKGLLDRFREAKELCNQDDPRGIPMARDALIDSIQMFADSKLVSSVPGAKSLFTVYTEALKSTALFERTGFQFKAFNQAMDNIEGQESDEVRRMAYLHLKVLLLENECRAWKEREFDLYARERAQKNPSRWQWFLGGARRSAGSAGAGGSGDEDRIRAARARLAMMIREREPVKSKGDRVDRCRDAYEQFMKRAASQRTPKQDAGALYKPLADAADRLERQSRALEMIAERWRRYKSAPVQDDYINGEIKKTEEEWQTQKRRVEGLQKKYDELARQYAAATQRAEADKTEHRRLVQAFWEAQDDYYETLARELYRENLYLEAFETRAYLSWIKGDRR